MLLCPNCQQPIREGAKFCNRCGASLQTGGAPVATAQEPSAPTPGSAPPEIAQPIPTPAAFAPQSDAAPLPGKANPTGPMSNGPGAVEREVRGAAESAETQFPQAPAAEGAPASFAPQLPEQPAPGAPPPYPPAEAAPPPAEAASEAAVPPPPPPPPASPEAVAAEVAATVSDQYEVSQSETDNPYYTMPDPAATPSEALYNIDPYSMSDSPAMETQEDDAQDDDLPAADEEAPTVLVPRPSQNEIPVTPELLASLGEQTPLAPGMLLEDRYRVEEVLNISEEENLYRVSDLRGYLRCWACGTEFPNNPDTERFCSNCGADMLGKDYWLRERPHTEEEAEQAAAPTDAGQAAAEETPGMNGAHPEEGTAGYVDADSEELDWPTQPMTAIASFIIGSRHYRVEAIETEDPAFPLGVTLVAGARADVGQTRRGNPNEDSLLVLNFSRNHESVNQPFGIFIVADGLGGHDDGQTASRRAIGEIANYLVREVLTPALRSGQYADGDTLGANLKAAIEAANLALVGSNDQTGSDMGSTATGAMIIGDTAYIINVGDSRTYLFDTASLQPITVDHSLVMQLVAGGLINREDIYTHPHRNQILRSLGDRRDVQVDLFVQKLKPGYRLVVCCDGLWEMVHDDEIEQILRENSDPQAAADRLMEAANKNGGEDNISVIVVEAREYVAPQE